MNRIEAMVLNTKIRRGMKHSTRDISSFDGLGLQIMLHEMKHEELDLITFCALADIYDIPYKFTVYIETPELRRTRIINSKDDVTLWNELDSLYKEYTGHMLDSGCLTYRELVNEFSKINGKVSFE